MRYTKKPVTVEAVRFIGLTDFGDPQFDTAPTGGVVPEWLMEAMAAPEGDESSIWVSRVDGEKPILRIGSQTWLHEISENDWITNEDSNISSFNSEFFEAFFFPAEAQAEIAPAFTQAAKDGERSLLLDMQSECIQLRVALAKARDYLMYEYPEMAAMCQKAIDCRPATGSEDCPKLEAIHERGVEALAALPDPDYDLEAALEDGPMVRSQFVIGEGFKTVGDSDGDDGA